MMVPKTIRIRRYSLFRRACRKAVNSVRGSVMVLLSARTINKTLLCSWLLMASMAKTGETRELVGVHQLERPCRTQYGHISDLIRVTFRYVTVSFAR